MRAFLITLGVAVLGMIAPAQSQSAERGPEPVPETMLAAAFDRGGGPEVLSLHRLPVPKVEAGEVLIAVHAAGIGAWELAFRRNPPPRATFPLVLGSDGAGVVAAVGPGVRGFKAGDKVYGYGSRSGFYAEYAVAKAENVSHIPEGIELAEAGILAASGFSALQGIDEVLRMERGETLIIHGGAGAVGTLAIQFAKLRGVKVLATATSEEGLALMRRLGADSVVNGRTGDIVAAAQAFAPRGVDAVLALAGGDALERCIDTLRRDGRGRVAYLYGMEPLPKPRFAIRMTLYSIMSGTQEFQRLNRAVTAAKLIVPIGATFPLANAAEAHQRAEARGVLGKIVLRVR
jgi:NADPH:quinone reductase